MQASEEKPLLKKKIDLTNRGELESNFKKLELRQKLTALQLKAAREEIKLLQEKVDASGKKKKKKKTKEK